MCRLFGMLGNAASSPERWLLSSERSLLVQSDSTPDQIQTDGWGIAWRDSQGVVRIEKGVGLARAPEEVGRFTQAAKTARGPVVVAHLRKASNPLKLSRERLIALENSQPFAFGDYLFAHNGSILHPGEVRPLLGRFEPMVRGVNDSEVLFWLLLRHLDEDPDPVVAYTRAVRTLHEVWAETGSGGAGPYTGLNVVLTRGGNELWAFCQSRGEHGTGLMDPTRPYYEMVYLFNAKELIVGSEPFDARRSAWRSLKNGTYLHARQEHGLVAVDTGAIPLPLEFRPIAPETAPPKRSR
jgi:predicted glutamine amidotransferase